MHRQVIKAGAALLLAAGAVILPADPATAQESSDRRRPGQVPEREIPPQNPNNPPLPRYDMPPEVVPIPDRWRLLETLGVLDDRPWNPYVQNTLKGDKPVFDDWFVVLNLISDTIVEPRSFPVPVGVQSSDRPDSNDLFGGVDGYVFAQNTIFNLTVVKGRTAFKPPDYEFRFTPVWQVNRVNVDERRVLFADPGRGTLRKDQHIGIQELFLDYHIRNVSTRYDFDSVRVGIQPINTDFRGFLFQDNQFDIRLFGNRDNNLWQYNIAYFRRMEKETNSGLNDISDDLRKDDVFLVNLFRQDFPVLGLTSQATLAYNRNREDDEFFFDSNNFLVRPAPFGDSRQRVYDVGYVGLNMDGRVDWVNLTASFYAAIGRDRDNVFTGVPADIRAFFFATEPSVDFSWARYRFSFLYATGDSDPFDNTQGGFDAIFENPQFAGADTSYWIRQTIPLIGGGGVTLSNRNGILPALRPSKEQGQSNFVNPGLVLVGMGQDFDITPEIRLSTNFNYMWFDNTSVLETLRQQGDIPRNIGADLSLALIWRPWFVQNAVFRLSGAALLPGKGFDALYDDGGRTDVYYSVLANLVLSY